MKDREIVLTVFVLIAAYWWFVVRGKGTKALKGNRSMGSGTVAGGASKQPTRFQNSNPKTNAHQGRNYRPAPIAKVGANVGVPPASAAGAPQIVPTRRSSTATGLVSSFVSPSWPTQRVTSTGTRRISSGQVQVPGYAAVPLTTQGPGGGGSWLH
jgi:hypothetical protein